MLGSDSSSSSGEDDDERKPRRSAPPANQRRGSSSSSSSGSGSEQEQPLAASKTTESAHHLGSSSSSDTETGTDASDDDLLSIQAVVRAATKESDKRAQLDKLLAECDLQGPPSHGDKKATRVAQQVPAAHTGHSSSLYRQGPRLGENARTKKPQTRRKRRKPVLKPVPACASASASNALDAGAKSGGLPGIRAQLQKERLALAQRRRQVRHEVSAVRAAEARCLREAKEQEHRREREDLQERLAAERAWRNTENSAKVEARRKRRQQREEELSFARKQKEEVAKEERRIVAQERKYADSVAKAAAAAAERAKAADRDVAAFRRQTILDAQAKRNEDIKTWRQKREETELIALQAEHACFIREEQQIEKELSTHANSLRTISGE